MLWFLAPAAIIAGKLIYDAVKDDSSSSNSSSASSYHQEAEENRKKELAQRQKTQKEKMAKSLISDLSRVFHKYSPDYRFSGDISLDKMRAFTKINIEDEDDADKAICIIAGEQAGIDWRNISKEASELEAKKRLLLELYESLEAERARV